MPVSTKVNSLLQRESVIATSLYILFICAFFKVFYFRGSQPWLHTKLCGTVIPLMMQCFTQIFIKSPASKLPLSNSSNLVHLQSEQIILYWHMDEHYRLTQLEFKLTRTLAVSYMLKSKQRWKPSKMAHLVLLGDNYWKLYSCNK